jgi:hypothetical protein
MARLLQRELDSKPPSRYVVYHGSFALSPASAGAKFGLDCRCIWLRERPGEEGNVLTMKTIPADKSRVMA